MVSHKTMNLGENIFLLPVKQTLGLLFEIEV